MSEQPLKLGVLVSGRGSDLQSIIDAIESGDLNARITVVISNNPSAYGLERARKYNIPAVVHSSKDYSKNAFRERFLEILKSYDVELVVLAGYLKKIPDTVIDNYPRRIINIHPALLPKFGGKGFYGMRVHKAVLQSGEKESGVTVHFVDNKYDHGEIIYQQKVPIKEDDTPETLSERVLAVEHQVLPRVIGMIAEGKIS
ncbi:MAG: phosphoribosylglycinamide formyltransferase [candidate division Zixibacteria bacterium]|nr:phosphoribosylglycinamide formyltransferase [candidate division Zixibacteria bacterium]